jgi:ABC-2 type transport system ATP-binding protein
MIRVSHLTMRYPGRVAVDDISFDVSAGEIVGFLGPNGAGKTTTLRILTGYLPASGGRAEVAGFDVARQPLEVRRRIGYLPENCPLYPEMRVDEYLRFRAALRGLRGGRLRRRLEEVKALCGIEREGRRIIGQLSKGFRQRVGLADSLVHEPEMLILDEPTVGLDPNQIRQVRTLIGELARKHTILLSTHILPEVEVTCRRVIILHRGKIVASDAPGHLQRLLAGDRVVAEIRGPAEAVRAALAALPGVGEVAVDAARDWLLCTVARQGDEDLRPAVYRAAAQHGWDLRELRHERGTLEDVFVNLTRAEAATGAAEAAP